MPYVRIFTNDMEKQKITLLCAGCRQNIPGREHLTCVLCIKPYDLDCANVSIQRYLNTMSPNRKNNWKCPACVCKAPKGNNTNTPVRPRDCVTQTMSPEIAISNVTIRKKTTSSNETLDSTQLDLLGDTAYTHNYTTPVNSPPQSELTLHNLSELITARLKENNTSIIQDLQNTIQTEINKAIIKLKEDMSIQTSNLRQQNEKLNSDIEHINTQIENLKEENRSLKNEIQDLERKIKSPEKYAKPEENNRKIVIYGLGEHYKESEIDLHNRIIHMFNEVYNLNILGYIEDAYWIGKYNNNKNRPLVIELLSKRMVKFIIKNTHYLKGTRLSISKFLDKTELKDKRAKYEQMMDARKNGLHAVIRNNELYIEGKLIDWKHNITNTTLQPITLNHSANNITAASETPRAGTEPTTDPQRLPQRNNHPFRNKEKYF